MMDGRVRAIREALDGGGCDRTVLMSYSAKFSSKFYGPFRAAADSAPKGDVKLKDRTTYQIDPARPSDALECSRRDAEEGADILMVKPGLPYLDVLATLSREIARPWAVYEVSGEYAAIELLAAQGLVDGPAAHVEAWTAFTRAGASMIITYGARYARQWLQEK
jgi:porphobilinogen synthase